MAKKQTPAEVVSFPTTPYMYQLRSSSWTTTYRPQGCCANGNYIYTMTVANNSTAQALNRLNLNTLAVTKLADYTDMSHANSISIDAENNLMYVATMDATLGIKVIDLTDYTVVRNFQTFWSNGTAYPPWRIAYDRKAKVLYSCADQWVQVYDPVSGTRLRSITLKDYVDEGTDQGMETDGEYIYLSWSGSNKVSIYTLNGDFVKTQTITSNYELETLVYDWNGHFYGCYNSSGALRVYGALTRTFNEKYEMTYIPVGAWGKQQTGGSITVNGVRDFTMESTAASSWTICIRGIGYSRSYTDMIGKKITIDYDLERVSGSGGDVYVCLFTTDTQAATTGSERLYYKTYSASIPGSGSKHVTKEIVIGTDFVAPAGSEGTRLGYWIYLYAGSGNKCSVKNFKILMEA